MSVKCTSSFKEITIFKDENIAELAFFWRDTETKQHLFSVSVHVAVPLSMKNIDEIKIYALQKAKELVSGIAGAEYE
jgi:hypothetical protein